MILKKILGARGAPRSAGGTVSGFGEVLSYLGWNVTCPHMEMTDWCYSGFLDTSVTGPGSGFSEVRCRLICTGVSWLADWLCSTEC